jgi:hypothetical protein
LAGLEGGAAASFCALLATRMVYPGLVAAEKSPIRPRVSFSDLTDQNLRSGCGAGRTSRTVGCRSGSRLFRRRDAPARSRGRAYYPPSALFYMLAAPGAGDRLDDLFHLLIAGVGAAMVPGISALAGAQLLPRC